MTTQFCRCNLKSIAFGGCLALLGVVSGCQRGPHSGREMGQITAKVTYGSEPVTSGYINFINHQTGLGGGGPLGADGEILVKEIPIGDYIVTVIPPLPSNTDPNPKPVNAEFLPPKYRSESTSTLRATVGKGENYVEFDLKK